MLAGQYRHAEAQFREIEATLMVLHRGNELSQRLAAIPSVGPVGVMAMAAKIGDARRFRPGRDFAAFIGLTPKDHTTAGRKKLGGITRAGDEMLRSHLVCGATAVIHQLKTGKGHNSLWLKELVARKPEKLAAVALANKTARIAWKLMISGERYRTKYAETALNSGSQARGRPHMRTTFLPWLVHSDHAGPSEITLDREVWAPPGGFKRARFRLPDLRYFRIEGILCSYSAPGD